MVAAVSGGSDSVALLLLLRELAARGELVLAGLAHLHHHIRGADADGDAAFCRELADRIGVPVFAGDADVPAAAKRDGVSIEVAGREARQRFYAEAMTTARRGARRGGAYARRPGGDRAAAVDAGRGTAGLAGMAPRRGPLVRPVLDATRASSRVLARARRNVARGRDQSRP